MAIATVGNVKKEYVRGTSFEDIARDFQSNYKHRIILANVNGKLTELHKTIQDDCEIDFRDISQRAGYHTFRRTICLVMLRAFSDVCGDKLKRVKIDFSVSKGYYCTLEPNIVSSELLKKVKERMEEIVELDKNINKASVSLSEAEGLFRRNGLRCNHKLFKYRMSSKINVYSIGDYSDYFYGYMAPSTGYLTKFDLFEYNDGFILLMPTRNNPEELPEFDPQTRIYETMKASCEMGKFYGIETVGDLNDAICQNGFEKVRLISEALQEGEIAKIADKIAERNAVKFVMIAGPSSSGKTSFSYRLSVQLMTKGLKPHAIGLDNYYKNRVDCPKDENGNYDFECLEALDVEGFNTDMTKLINGETVDIPVYNFTTGKREYRGNYMKLSEGDVLVIEGIHGLNEKMSYTLPKESKYKIYISALTTLNLDEHNRIPTTDVRLLRRIIRDARTRNTKANETIGMWQSVRNGEEKYIFPFQNDADAHFNSSLLYELSILKQFAEPLLYAIDKDDESYHEAKRLLKFLDYFIGVTSEGIPNNSLLREFIGGSIFNV